MEIEKLSQGNFERFDKVRRCPPYTCSTASFSLLSAFSSSGCCVTGRHRSHRHASSCEGLKVLTCLKASQNGLGIA